MISLASELAEGDGADPQQVAGAKRRQAEKAPGQWKKLHARLQQQGRADGANKASNWAACRPRSLIRVTPNDRTDCGAMAAR